MDQKIYTFFPHFFFNCIFLSALHLTIAPLSIRLCCCCCKCQRSSELFILFVGIGSARARMWCVRIICRCSEYIQQMCDLVGDAFHWRRWWAASAHNSSFGFCSYFVFTTMTHYQCQILVYLFINNAIFRRFCFGSFLPSLIRAGNSIHFRSGRNEWRFRERRTSFSNWNSIAIELNWMVSVWIWIYCEFICR